VRTRSSDDWSVDLVTDHAALELAIKCCRARSEDDRRQIDSMLASGDRTEVAQFASYSCQNKALNLRPWQDPPCAVDHPDDPQPRHAMDGRVEAAMLLRDMLAHGVSRWHPDPLAALKAAKRKRTN
jgi:hypothetical protein